MGQPVVSNFVHQIYVFALLHIQYIAFFHFALVWSVLDHKFYSSVQKTQGFCVADFATHSDERRSRSKIVLLFNTNRRTLRLKI